jgi:hypothetical protein
MAWGEKNESFWQGGIGTLPGDNNPNGLGSWIRSRIGANEKLSFDATDPNEVKSALTLALEILSR